MRGYKLIYILIIELPSLPILGLSTRSLQAQDTLSISTNPSEDTEQSLDNIEQGSHEIPGKSPLNNIFAALENVSSNTTLTENNSEHTDSAPPKYVNCLQGYANESVVQLTNDTELIKLLVPDPKITVDKDAPGPCVAVLFYSKNCRFSSLAAPHYNALPRAFPDIKFVAINAMRYHLFNTQNGIVGVPTMLIFHNGKPVIRYNVSEYTLESFTKFISRYTGIDAVENSVVTSADFAGPVVSSTAKESDMFLVLSWSFIILCSCYYFTKSKWWIWIVEAIQRNWRDSEVHAHHDHQD